MIFGPGGNEISRKVMRGKEDLGGDAFNPPSHSRKAIPPAFKRKLEELFSDRGVVAAFR